MPVLLFGHALEDLCRSRECLPDLVGIGSINAPVLLFGCDGERKDFVGIERRKIAFAGFEEAIDHCGLVTTVGDNSAQSSRSHPAANPLFLTRVLTGTGHGTMFRPLSFSEPTRPNLTRACRNPASRSVVRLPVFKNKGTANAESFKMYSELKTFFERPEPFSAYTVDSLWTDPHRAGQMLACHLDQTTELASRRDHQIGDIVAWLDNKLGFSARRSPISAAALVFTPRRSRGAAARLPGSISPSTRWPTRCGMPRSKGSKLPTPRPITSRTSCPKIRTSSC